MLWTLKIIQLQLIISYYYKYGENTKANMLHI